MAWTNYMVNADAKFIHAVYQCGHKFVCKVHDDTDADGIAEMKQRAAELDCPHCASKKRKAAA